MSARSRVYLASGKWSFHNFVDKGMHLQYGAFVWTV